MVKSDLGKHARQWTALVGLAACCLAGIGSRAAWAGSVLTRAGEAYVGKVELRAANQILVTPAEGAAKTIAMSEVARLSMAEAAPAPPAVTADAHLPAPWQQRDVGLVKDAGSGVEAKGAFSLRGAGWGIWGGEDSFHFVYQPMTGDGQIVARVVDLPTDDNPFFAGLTIREGLEPGCVQASLMLRSGGTPRINCRPIRGGLLTSELKQQHWIRLLRTGELVGAFCSQDGTTWVPVGWVNVKMKPTVYVGFALAATGNQDLAAATFDNVALRSQDSGPSEGLGLVDGTVLAGHVKFFDDQTWCYTDSAAAEHNVPARNVAYMFTRPLPADLRRGLLGDRAKAILLNGDSLEGEVRGHRDGRIVVDSLVLGPQKQELNRILAVVLRATAPEGTFVVATRDGTAYRCKDLTVGNGVVTATGALMGPVRVNAAELAWVRVEPTPGKADSSEGVGP